MKDDFQCIQWSATYGATCQGATFMVLPFKSKRESNRCIFVVDSCWRNTPSRSPAAPTTRLPQSSRTAGSFTTAILRTDNRRRLQDPIPIKNEKKIFDIRHRMALLRKWYTGLDIYFRFQLFKMCEICSFLHVDGQLKLRTKSANTQPNICDRRS